MYSCILECSTPGRWRYLVGLRPTRGFKSMKGSGATPIVLILELSRRDKNSVWKGWKFPASPLDALWYQKESVMPEQSQPGRGIFIQALSLCGTWKNPPYYKGPAGEHWGVCHASSPVCPKRSNLIKFFRFNKLNLASENCTARHPSSATSIRAERAIV